MARRHSVWLLLPLLLFACAPKAEEPVPPTLKDLISSTLVVQRVVDRGAPTPQGCVRFRINRRDDRALVINLLVDLNRDGSWDDYAVGPDTQSEWLVRNLPLPVLPGEYCAWTTLLESPSGRTARCVLSETILDQATVKGSVLPGGVESFPAVVTVTTLATDSQANPAEGYVGGGGSILSPGRAPTPPVVFVEDPAVVVAAVDSTTATGLVRRGLTLTPQGPNTCVMHAMATSMAWMARKHEFTDRFKDEEGNDLYDVTTPEGVNEMAYNLDEVGAMDWSQESGIAPGRILPGKLAFVGQKKLPLETRAVDAGPGVDLFAQMKAALQQGCDVEIVLLFPDVRMNHMVVAAGFSESGGSRSLVVRNPDSPNASDVYSAQPGGIVENFPFAKRVRNPTIGRLYIECYKAPSQTSFLGVSPSRLEFAHVPGDDACPQEAGAFALTNNGGETAWWSTTTQGRTEVTLTPSSGRLEPGATANVAVLYNCGGGGAASFSLPVRLLAGTGSGATDTQELVAAGTVTEAVTRSKTVELRPLLGPTLGHTITISHTVPKNARVLRHGLIDDATGLPPATGVDQPFPDHTWSILSESRDSIDTAFDHYTVQFRYERIVMVDHEGPAKYWSYVVRYAVP